MISEPGRIQSITGSQLNLPEYAKQREHLELLITGALSPTSARTLQDYALAYVDRFQGNVLQLEHEWKFLEAVLQNAWREEQYEVVARLAAALAYPAGRRDNFVEAKRVLQLGIVASRRARDQQRFASLLNRLGGLVFVYGRYHQGYRLWQTGLCAIESEGSPAGLWEPLTSFAHIADMLGNYVSAQHFLEIYYTNRQTAEPDGLAVALFIRGLYARFMGHLDKAQENFCRCLPLLTSVVPLSPARQLFLVVVQAELARTQGHYSRSQQYTETALALARAFGDHYTFAILLIDQGMFAWQEGRYDEIRRIFPYLRELEHQVAFPNIAAINHLLAQQLSQQNGEVTESHVSLTPIALNCMSLNALSKREKAILQLVAEGFSNQEIAASLVITTATVKKHLEHIYIKLDVHNRTSAILQGKKLKLIL